MPLWYAYSTAAGFKPRARIAWRRQHACQHIAWATLSEREVRLSTRERIYAEVCEEHATDSTGLHGALAVKELQ